MITVENQEPTSTGARLRILAEVTFVFSAMLAMTWVTKSAELIGAGSIAIWGGIILATVFMRRRGVTWASYGLTLPGGLRAWARALGLATLLVVTIFVFMAFILEPVTTKLGLEEASGASDRFEFFLGKPLAFLGFILGVVWFGAALGEELFMRGFMLNRLADLFGRGRLGWSAALVIHAAIFGAMHAYQGLPGMIGTGFIGFIFGLFYLAGNRRLVPLILAHGIINTIGLTAYYISDGAIT